MNANGVRNAAVYVLPVAVGIVLFGLTGRDWTDGATVGIIVGAGAVGSHLYQRHRARRSGLSMRDYERMQWRLIRGRVPDDPAGRAAVGPEIRSMRESAWWGVFIGSAILVVVAVLSLDAAAGGHPPPWWILVPIGLPLFLVSVCGWNVYASKRAAERLAAPPPQ